MTEDEPPTLLELIGANACVAGWSSAALQAQIKRFDLTAHGVPPKARIGLVLPGGTVNAVGLLSALSWHCVIPLNPTETTSGMVSKLEGARAVAIVAFEAFESAAAAAAALAVPLIPLRSDPSGPEGAVALPPPPPGAQKAQTSVVPRTPMSSEDVVLVLHTSGTTGKSKRVLFSHRRLVASGQALADSMGLKPSDVGYNVMPLYHVGGIACNLMCPLVSRGRMIFREHFSADGALADLGSSHLRVSWWYAAPAMWQMVLKYAATLSTPPNAPYFRIVRSGAATLPHAEALKLAKLFPRVTVLPTYSMTECMPVCAPPADYKLTKPGSVGVPRIPLIIAGPKGEKLAAGEVGEVTLSGMGKVQLFSGYEPDGGYPNAAAAEAQVGGTFQTGDRGYLDKDGWLFLVGRSKECVNRGGEIIPPVEV